ncbi:hypothetical protein E2P86_08880 [Sphingobacterium psychroaquaticum]|uniref:hypothetical protein n=1 Tax=Sphingobacterium psychroaquaticum TaxID=561061 RepID=UPI00106CED54|nr:hypothetical protein [Sphingobacterium psychroaquaticum]QBQ41262.1 hypothetical protein E2P86_08880 [Sphingobacterium psychroaquaticum]
MKITKKICQTLFCLVLILLSGCSKDYYLNGSLHQNDKLDIEIIKSKFEKSGIDLSFNKENTNLTPLWDGAFRHSSSIYVPIRFKNAFINIGGKKNVPYEQLNFLSVTLKDNEIHFSTIRISPTEWITSNKRLKVNGSISFYDFKSKSKFSINLSKDRGPINKLASANPGGDVECMDVLVSQYKTDVLDIPCTGGPGHTVDHNCDCDGTNCSPPMRFYHTYVTTTIVQQCWGGSGGGNGGGGGGGGGSPGGGPGGPSTDPGNYPPDVPFAQCYTGEGFQSHEEFMQCQDYFSNVIPIDPLTKTQLLGEFITLTNQEATFLASNETITDKILDFITSGEYNISPTGNAIENEIEVAKLELATWAIKELTSGNITWEDFELIFINGVTSDFDDDIIVETNVPTVPSNYSAIGITDPFAQSEFNSVLNNLQNDITGDPIEFYLISVYKNSKILNSSVYSVASNSIKVGEFTLTPHYDSNSLLKFYTATRNQNRGIEYIIRADALSMFKSNYTLYKAASNAFYLNGIPSTSQIQLAAGDFFHGVTNSWIDAIRDPSYYVYITHVLYGIGVNTKSISFRSTTIRNTKKVSITIYNYTPSQIRAMIQQKHGGTWVEYGDGRLRLVSGSDTYFYYPFSKSTGKSSISYRRNNKEIGVFRFND